MNSLGVDPFVHSFYDDLRDGIVLIQVFIHSSGDLINETNTKYSCSTRSILV